MNGNFGYCFLLLSGYNGEGTCVELLEDGVGVAC